MMRTSRMPEMRFCIDDELLYASGVRDFDRVDASVPLSLDFSVPDEPPPGVTVMPLR